MMGMNGREKRAKNRALAMILLALTTAAGLVLAGPPDASRLDKDGNGWLETVTLYPNLDYYNTGTVYGDSGNPCFDDSTLMHWQGGPDSVQYRAWARFNTEPIPDSSRITEIKLRYYITQQDTPTYLVKQMSVDPCSLRTNPDSVFLDIADGVTYCSTYTDSTGWHTNSLDTIACRHMEKLLGSNWFAVGFYECESLENRYAFARGWDSIIYQPRLIVTYLEPPTVKVEVPDSGEVWPVNTRQKIECRHDGGIAECDSVLYSRDAGNTWVFQFKETAADSHYWDVPDDPTDSARIRVVAINAAGEGSDDSDNDFTILAPPTVEVMDPHGGEKWPVDSLRTIRWRHGGGVPDEDSIWYSTDSGGHWAFVARKSPADTLHNWYVPDTPSEHCLVRVKAVSTAGYDEDTSKAVFTILGPPTVEVVKPNGGEKWPIGSVKTIRWRHGGGIPDRDSIWYSTDNGADWTFIRAKSPAVASDTWTVPAKRSIRCLVKVKAVNLAGSGEDRSDSVFTIEKLDVGVTQIIAPVDTVDSGGTVTPKVMVENFGNSVVAEFPVIFRIGTFYEDDTTVSKLGVGEATEVSFDNWRVLKRGEYSTRCTTALDGDMRPENDAVIGSVFVKVLDAQSVSILAPPEVVKFDTIISPKARVRNNGNTTVTFAVRFEIGAQYWDTTRVRSLSPGAEDIVVFGSWGASTAGTFPTRCYTMLPEDMNCANDTVAGTVWVVNRDVGVKQIIEPVAPAFDSAYVVEPEVIVKNFGNEQARFSIFFTVSTVDTLFYNRQCEESLAPGKSTPVVFPLCTLHFSGQQTARCSTWFGNDQCPADDTASVRFLVAQTPSVHLRTPNSNAVFDREEHDSIAFEWDQRNVIKRSYVFQLWRDTTGPEPKWEIDTVRRKSYELLSKDLDSLGSYYWRVGVKVFDNIIWNTERFRRFWLDTALPDSSMAPVADFFNFPNPFSLGEGTWFRFIPMRSLDKAEIVIYNTIGERVATIDCGQNLVGRIVRRFAWDGRDSNGKLLASGVYLAVLRVKVGEREDWEELPPKRVAIRPHPR